MFRQNLLCTSVPPLSLVLALGTTEKKYGLIVFSAFLQIFAHIGKLFSLYLSFYKAAVFFKNYIIYLL